MVYTIPTLSSLMRYQDYPLPEFTHVEDLPEVSEEEIEASRLARKSEDVLKAEALCKAGDLAQATVSVKQLLQSNLTEYNFHGCLLNAVDAGHEDITQMLVSSGAPVSTLVIQAAIKRKSLRVLSLLLEHGWEINENEAWCRPPLLAYAMTTNPDEALVSWFLENGADPNKKCHEDITPLSKAASKAPLPILKQLLDHCPPSTVFRGELLHCVARRQSDDAEEALLLVLQRVKPDINGMLYSHEPLSYELHKLTGLGTALHEAAMFEGRPGVARLLIENGIDVFKLDSNGNTALELAEQKNNDAVADVIRYAVAEKNKNRVAKM